MTDQQYNLITGRLDYHEESGQFHITETNRKFRNDSPGWVTIIDEDYKNLYRFFLNDFLFTIYPDMVERDKEEERFLPTADTVIQLYQVYKLAINALRDTVKYDLNGVVDILRAEEQNVKFYQEDDSSNRSISSDLN